MEDILEEQQKQIKQLAQAVLELSKEVRINREFIEKQASLSKRTVDALKHLTS